MGRLPKWVRWASLAVVNLAIVAVIVVLVTNGLKGETTITPTPTPAPIITPTPVQTPAEGYPDLVVTRVEFSQDPLLLYHQITVSVTILNQGTTEAGGFHWELTSETSVGTGDLVGGLAAGESITQDDTISGYDTGTWTATVEVDDYNDVNEGPNEHNNTYSETFTCIAEE